MPSQGSAGLLVVLSVAAVLVACSREPSPQDGVPRYERVNDVVAAMRAGGAPCEDVRRLPEEHESLADFGLCFLETSPEHEIDIYVFETQSDRDAWLYPGSNLEPLAKVVGPTWIVTTGTRANAEVVQGAIGGRVDAPSPDPVTS